MEKLTKQDVLKIQEEITKRKLEVRPKAIKAVKEAREHGDLSENFEYYAAKKDKNKNEARIRYLERLLKSATIIEDNTKEDEVGLYSKVEVEFADDKTTEEYKIVTSIRGDSLKGLISIESPLGKALLNKKAGDVVNVKVNDNISYELLIKNVVKTVDDGSDDIKSYWFETVSKGHAVIPPKS